MLDKKLNIQNAVNLFVLTFASIFFRNAAFAGEVNYPIDSYESGQILDHEDLNSKFNQISNAVNDNNSKSTLDDLSCISGQVAMWDGLSWTCADTVFMVSESTTDPNPFLLASQKPGQAADTIQSVIVFAPSQGSVLISFSATYRMSHQAGNIDEIDIGISENDQNAVVTSLATWRYLSLSSNFPTVDFFGSVSANAEFSVPAAGTYVYYILGASNKDTKTDSIYVTGAATQAIFIPERQ